MCLKRTDEFFKRTVKEKSTLEPLTVWFVRQCSDGDCRPISSSTSPIDT